MRIDDSIRALSAALQSIGWSALRPPSDVGDLEEFEALIAPLTIPSELKRFWETVDVYATGVQSLDVLSCPELSDLPHSIEQTTRLVGDHPSLFPVALLIIGYTSHVCMAIELDDPEHGPGGALFEFDLVGDDFTLMHLALSDWLDEMTDDISAGKIVVEDGPNGSYLQRPDVSDFWERETPPPAHPVYGPAATFPRDDSRQWPLHWQRSNELGWSSPVAYGSFFTYVKADRVSTIAEVLTTESDEPIEATIVAQVLDFAIDREWERLRVTDGSGVADLHAQRIGTGAKAVLSGERLEFDIVVPAGPRAPAEAFTVVAGSRPEQLLDPVLRGLLQRFDQEADLLVRSVRLPRD